MNREFLEQHNLHPRSIRYKNHVQIIEDKNKKIVVKKNRKKIPNLYSYLYNRNFTNFPSVLTSNDEDYEITEYIEDINIEDAQKIEDMIYLLSILHNKTTFYKEVELETLKKIYEEMSEEYQYLFSYYQSIHTMIEEEVYMSPSHYYFILQASDIYQILIKGKEALENWYMIASQKKTLRFALNHNHLKKEHLLENQQLYFISWDLAENNFPVIDLTSLFKYNYMDVDLFTILSLYESKYKLLDYEYYFFLAKICLLIRIDFNESEETKIEEITKFLQYVQKVKDFLLKQDSTKANNNTNH